MTQAQSWRPVVLLAGACWAVIGTGCMYDEDDRCGDDRELKGGACACKPGSMDKNGECVDASTSMPDSDDAGADSTDGAMGGGPCATHDQCGKAAFCPSGTCRPLPTGEGEPCASQDDCRSFEASFCVVGSPIEEICVVPNCTDDSCSPGHMCFDVSQFDLGPSTLCIEPF